VRKALGRLLHAAGYEYELLEAAEAYLACTPPEPPACLLLDIRMPGMTGLELQRAIEGTPMDLPIVFITGHADEELLQTLSRRAVNVLYKPLDDVALLAAIDQALAKSTLR
jgi:FixJ family two-component response regulator